MESEKHIFITGVSSGLGFGLANYYLNEGWNVWACSRRGSSELEDLGKDRFHHLSIDLSDLETAPNYLKPFLSKIPSCHTAILNAGVLGEVKELKQTSVQAMRRVMDVNVWANKVIMDQLLALNNKPKLVVAISSGAAVRVMWGSGNYGLSKAALNLLMAYYAEEEKSVHFIALAPGLIDTAMQDYLTNLPDDEAHQGYERLKEAKGTKDMPEPLEAGVRVGKAIGNLFDYPSGEFVDVRQMN